MEVNMVKLLDELWADYSDEPQDDSWLAIDEAKVKRFRIEWYILIVLFCIAVLAFLYFSNAGVVW